MNKQKKNIPQKGATQAVKPQAQVKGKQPVLNARDMDIALLAGVAVIILICFRYTLHNSFLSDWDDWIYVSKDKYIKTLTALNFHNMLFHDITLNYYHPLTMLSLALNYQFSELNPWGYYFTNILLHITNAVLIFYFIKVLMAAMVKAGYKAIPAIPWLVAAGALLHGIHPMHVESVSWLAERKDVMYGVFYFAGLIMYVRYLGGATFKWMLYVNIVLAAACLLGMIELRDFSLDVTHTFNLWDPLILLIPFIALATAIVVEVKYKTAKIGLFYVAEFFLLSMFSKPMAVSFPLSILVVDILLKRDLAFATPGKGWLYNELRAIIKLVMEKWAFFLIAVLSGLQSVFLEIGHNTVAFTNGYTVLQKLLIASYAFMMYTVDAFFPANLCSFYPYPNLISEQHYLPSAYYYAPFVSAVIVFVPLYLTRKDKNLFRVMLFGLGFYFVNLVFILQFLSAGTTVMSDRYSYVSYFGLIFPVIYLAHWLWQKSKANHIIIQGFLAAVCITLGYMCYERTQVWHDPETLWTDVIQKTASEHPQMPYFNLGGYYIDSGKFDKAYVNYTILTKIGSRDPLVFRNLAMIYGMRKQYDSAIYYFANALQYDSNDASIYTNRAITYANAGRMDLAMQDFTRAYMHDTSQYGALANAADIASRLGRDNESIKDYTILIRKKPDQPTYYMFRGNGYLNGGNPEMAIKDYLHSLQLEPKNSECMYNMSIAYHDIKDNTHAIQYANMAQNAGYKLPDNYLNTLK